jgi:hypothetical protein
LLIFIPWPNGNENEINFIDYNSIKTVQFLKNNNLLLSFQLKEIERKEVIKIQLEKTIEQIKDFEESKINNDEKGYNINNNFKYIIFFR